MYTNYGDRNFLERGVLVDSEHSDTVFDMLICNPYSDAEDDYQFAQIQVDIEDSWIDRKTVMSFIGMNEDSFDPIQYAIGCVDYYGPAEFGADSNYGATYNWQHVDSATIRKELSGYLIAWDTVEINES